MNHVVVVKNRLLPLNRVVLLVLQNSSPMEQEHANSAQLILIHQLQGHANVIIVALELKLMQPKLDVSNVYQDISLPTTASASNVLWEHSPRILEHKNVLYANVELNPLELAVPFVFKDSSQRWEELASNVRMELILPTREHVNVLLVVPELKSYKTSPKF